MRLRTLRSKLKTAIGHAHTVLRMQGDLVKEEERAALAAEIARLKQVRKRERNPKVLEDALASLEKSLSSPWAPLHPHSLAENFEVVVVAVAVAMAFRCYFFQPFKIPTGSMQPTLYGIHTEAGTTPTIFDRKPLSFLKWLATGDKYLEVRVTDGGRVIPIERTIKPGYITFRVAGKHYHVPADAIVEGGYLSREKLRDLRSDNTIPDGGVLWAGTVKSGDHVFVNRMTWNFRRPKRGDVMVFVTSGIKGLPGETHYIKRLSGLPGETVSIDPPRLLIDGKALDGPMPIRRITEKEETSPGGPRYGGYKVIGNIPAESRHPLRRPLDSITLGEGEYYALGDNTGNSRDSRFWGPVPAKNLIGTASFVYWPFPRFKLID